MGSGEDELRRAIALLVGHSNRPTADELERVLRRAEGRVFDGQRLTSRVVDGETLWSVETVN